MEPKRLKELAQDMANYIVKLSELNSDEIEIKITDKFII